MPLETRSSPLEAAIAAVALVALSVSSSYLISIARRAVKWAGIGAEIRYLGMKKSSIGGKQYLDYL